MKKLMMGVMVLALGAGVLLAQPQPGIGRFASLITTSTGATSLTVGGGITAGTGAVALVNTSGKIPALSSTYFTDATVPTSAITGSWTNTTFSAGDYTANGSMTFTVDSGDVAVNASQRFGGSIVWTVYILGASVGGTASTRLRIDVPGSVTFTQNCFGATAYSDNGTSGSGLFFGTSGASYVELLKSATEPNWSNTSTNNTIVGFTAVCPVS